jgi:anti-sigma factor RsiW
MSEPMSSSAHADIQELLGAYALDAVDPESAALVERHLAECPRCAIEVAQHHEVAGLLANSGGASPAHLWGRIADRLDGSPPAWQGLADRLGSGADRSDRVVGAGTGPEGPDGTARDDRDGVVSLDAVRARRRWPARVAAVVAVAAAVVAVVFGVQVHRLHTQVDALSAPASLSAAEQSALQQPTTRRISLTATGAAPMTGAVTVVLTDTGTGFVEAAHLSTLPRGQTYQLWGVIGGETISLGLLGSEPGVVPFSVAGGATVAAFAITAEHAGGVVHSVHQPVVAGEVTA